MNGLQRMTRDRMDPNYLVMNRDEAANTIGISVETLDRIRKEGKIPYRKIGGQIRFLPEDLSEYFKRCAVDKGGGS